MSFIDDNISNHISHTRDSQESERAKNHLDHNNNDLNNSSPAHSQVLGFVRTYRVVPTTHTRIKASTKYRLVK
jgi:hypothetical protein